MLYTIASHKNPHPKAHRHPFLAESPEGGRRFTYYDSCYAFAAARCPAWAKLETRTPNDTTKVFQNIKKTSLWNHITLTTHNNSFHVTVLTPGARRYLARARSVLVLCSVRFHRVTCRELLSLRLQQVGFHLQGGATEQRSEVNGAESVKASK
jgi:hypothetical protein